MKIVSVRAAAIRDPSVFIDPHAAPITLDAGTDADNPLSRHREFAGSGDRFDDPWPDAVCIVKADDGNWGIGMTRCAGPVVAIINDYLAPMIQGENATAIERHWNMMVGASGAHFGAAGLASHAISAIDLALWDLKGKTLGSPVYELLGGPAREAVHCYATSHDLDWCVELGFQAIKLCALHGMAGGTRSLDLNEEIVAGAREKLGTEFDLMMDFWLIHDAQFSIELGARLARYDLRWIEDFVQPDDEPGYARVRERLPAQTLAAGERWFTARKFHKAAHAQWVDVMQPDVQWVGGVTASMKVAAIAESAGLEVAMHVGCNDAYGQHLCLALPGNRWGEFYIGTAPGAALKGGYRHTPGMSLPVKGKLVPSDAPGFGIELTLDMIESAL
jgi:L-rhamnonate dehydratase